MTDTGSFEVDDDLWEHEIKAHPEVKTIRHGVTYWNELLYNGKSATGKHAIDSQLMVDGVLPEELTRLTAPGESSLYSGKTKKKTNPRPADMIMKYLERQERRDEEKRAMEIQAAHRQQEKEMSFNP